MKNERIYRETFINNTIQLVAEGGFEMATTRAISGGRKVENGTKLNEAHIYRVFGTKENLFEETFAMLDSELVCVLKEGLSDRCAEQSTRARYEKLFIKLWRFLLQNEKKCRYYTRYYYSAYFRNNSSREHMKKYEPLVETMASEFTPNADVWSLLHHEITVMLDFAIRVYNGEIEDTEDNAFHIFNVAYSSIAPYLR